LQRYVSISGTSTEGGGQRGTLTRELTDEKMKKKEKGRKGIRQR